MDDIVKEAAAAGRCPPKELGEGLQVVAGRCPPSTIPEGVELVAGRCPPSSD